jgi:hypothetical protein
MIRAIQQGERNCGKECGQYPIPPQFPPAANATTIDFTNSYAFLDCGGESVTDAIPTQFRSRKRI